MGRSGLFILIVIVLLAIGGYFWFSSQKANEANNATATEQPAAPETGAPGGEDMAAPESGTENMATPAPEAAPEPAPEPAPDNTTAPPSPQL